jgi:hypothetical protein
MKLNKWLLIFIFFISLLPGILFIQFKNPPPKVPLEPPPFSLQLESLVPREPEEPILTLPSFKDFALPLTLSFGLRKDQISSKSIPFNRILPTLKTKKRMRIIDWQGRIEFIFRHLYVRAGGDFGWPKKGKARQLIDDKLSELIDAEGSTMDTDIAFGFVFHTKKKTSLTPVFGYLYHYQKIRENSTQQTSSVSLEQEARFHWFGPFLGFNFSAQPFSRVLFNLGYSYHLVQVREALREQRAFSTMHGYPYAHELYNQGKNGEGHRGSFGTRFLLPRNWLLGLTARFQHFNSSRGNSFLETKQGALPLGFYSVQWWSLQTVLELSYEF